MESLVALLIFFGVIWLITRLLHKLLCFFRKPKPRLPTGRQLDYIEILLEEREADDIEFDDPQTIEQASALITRLKKLPYREDEE